MPGVTRDLRDLLDALVLADVVARVDGHDLRLSAPRGALTPDLVTRVRAGKDALVEHLAAPEGDAPLSPAQEALWRHQHLRPADNAYNIPVHLELDGPLSVECLRAALTTVASRQAVLRTVYRVRQGRPRQLVLPRSSVPLRFVDLTGTAAEHVETTVGALESDDARRAFDLAETPPLRATVVRLSTDRHRLLITRHHIAADGWSFGVLAGELAAAYAAHREGRRSATEPLAWRFADHAALQRSPDETGLRERGAEEIVQNLGTGPGIATIPDSRPRGDLVVGRVVAVVDATRTAAVHRVAQESGVTPFAVWAAAFGVALGAASDQESVIVGTPVAGRTHPAAELLVGCYAGLLPLRLSCGRRGSLRDAVREAHTATARILRLQDVPMEMVVDAARGTRHPLAGANALRAVLTFQNTPAADASFAGLTLRTRPPAALAPKFPLAVTVTPGLDASPATITAEYATDLVGASVVEDVVGGILDAVDAMVGRLDEVRRPSDRGDLHLPVTPLAPLVGERDPGTCFAAVASAGPDAIAISDRSLQLSYGALLRHARDLAGRLRRAGAGPEKLVAVHGEQGPWLVAALVGVATAGAAYLPLDPEDPPGRTEELISASGADVVLTDRAGADSLAWFDGPVVRYDVRECSGATAQSSTARTAAVRPHGDELAYVIHTSGSTGEPKGVMVPGSNVVQLVRAAAPVCRLTSADVCSMTHSVAFDFSVWEVWGALLSGARLVPVSRAVARDPVRLRDTLRSQQVTVHSATPTALAMLGHGVASGARTPDACGSSCSAGERCVPSEFTGWLSPSGTGPRLLNMYGITETTVHVTQRYLTHVDTAGAASPIGVPLPGVHATLDAASGEVLVGGWGVARGYLDRPGLTADRFRPADTGSRRYRSGDRVRPGIDGLDYVGRTDNQIKIRGYRVEPDEVAVVMAGHPDLAGAAVRVRGLRERDVDLLGCMVPAAGRRCPTPREMRRYLGDRLPGHLVPAAFATLDRLPLTRNGKLDRDALPSTADAEEVLEPPITPTEKRLARLWCDVLQVPHVGRHDDFFGIGGDSLQATRLHARVQDDFGIELPLGGMYAAFDLVSIAEVVDAVLDGQADTSARPVRASRR